MRECPGKTDTFFVRWAYGHAYCTNNNWLSIGYDSQLPTMFSVTQAVAKFNNNSDLCDWIMLFNRSWKPLKYMNKEYVYSKNLHMFVKKLYSVVLIGCINHYRSHTTGERWPPGTAFKALFLAPYHMKPMRCFDIAIFLLTSKSQLLH